MLQSRIVMSALQSKQPPHTVRLLVIVAVVPGMLAAIISINKVNSHPCCFAVSWLLAMQGFDITPDLRRMCPSLTLQQIYKLSEHHHDDWITAVGDNQGTKTIVLLETLKRAVESSGGPKGGQAGFATPPPASPRHTDGPGTPQHGAASVSSRHSFDDDDLLLDSQVSGMP